MVDRPAFSSHLSDIHVRLLLILVFLMCFHGCSERATNPEDTTPPARVVDLAVTEVTDHSATLAWTAPGDDGNKGQAWKYDLRYDERPLSGTWESATQVASLPRPQVAGSREQVVLEGLLAETTYYFALRTEDEVGNYDLEISNVTSASTAHDTIPPDAVTDLGATATTHRTVELTWTVPRDNWVPGLVGGYDIRCAVGPLTEETWPTARRVWGESAPQLPDNPDGLVADSLEANTTYSFGLRTLDLSGNASALSNIVRATTSPDTLPPALVTDLMARPVSHREVELTWSATGDDGGDGHASSYDIRYSNEPLSEETWPEANRVPGVPLPGASGFTEILSVQGLGDATLYFFGLKAQDDSGNWSGLSNEARARTLVDQIAPAAVSDLRIEVTTTTSLTFVWTAPGNDGADGLATEYDLRYSEAPLSLESWSSSMPVEAMPIPSAPGSRQAAAVFSLEQRKWYYFALRTSDARGNLSALSNIVQGSLKPKTSTTWYVKVDGTGDVPTIQAAIDASYDGDVVLVGPGTYDENINFHGKAVQLKSEAGPEGTVIDGSQGDDSVVLFVSGETNESIIEGFTITGGTGHQITAPGSRGGGGILCFTSTPTIRGNIIRGNEVVPTTPGAAGWGAGILTGWPPNTPEAVTIQNNVVEDNYSSGNGGGMSLVTRCVVTGNVIRRNRTGKGDGGGIYCTPIQDLVIQGNTIIENVANDHGGGAYISNGSVPTCEVEVSENVIIANVAWGADGAGAADGSGGGIWLHDYGAYVHHNTVAFNRAETQSQFFTPTGGILLLNPRPDVRVENNLIYRNENGGLGVFGLSRDPQTWIVSFRKNLVYGNGGQQVNTGTWDPGATIQLTLEDTVYEDPLFCIEGPESRGELSAISPAFHQGFGIIGAIFSPGCGPGMERGQTNLRFPSHGDWN